jgi:hypothetical protein
VQFQGFTIIKEHNISVKEVPSRTDASNGAKVSTSIYRREDIKGEFSWV